MSDFLRSVPGKAVGKAARLILMFTAGLSLAACDAPPVPETMRGDAVTGRRLIADYGCGSCHRIPGVPGANGDVGPPLADIRARAYLAGVLPNSFDNLVLWLVETQRIAPGSAMPDLDVSEAEAGHMAAYLYQREK